MGYDAARIRLRMDFRNCCPATFIGDSPQDFAMRSCSMRGDVCLDELLAVAHPGREIPSDDLAIIGMVSGARSPSDLPLRVLAARVGTHWDPVLRTFLGLVSVVPASAAAS